MEIPDTILADMDGTLTPARRPIEPPMIEALCQLLEKTQVGIVSGSGPEYIFEQLAGPDRGKWMDHPNLALFPCNGTRVVAFVEGEWRETYRAEMVEEIGEREYRLMVRAILQLQTELIDRFPDMPLTGTFVDYRGSLVNWCPIGRLAKEAARRSFSELDAKVALRMEYKDRLYSLLTEVYGIKDIDVTLGGATSFDIYPKGWDKSYVLRHLEGKQLFFVGDKCTPGGNDFALYRVLEPEDKAFVTSSPEETLRLIRRRWLE